MYSWRELKSDFTTIFDFSNSFIVKKIIISQKAPTNRLGR